MQLAIPEASDDERRAILREHSTIYERDYLPSVKAFDGVRDVFKVLSGQGGRVALATDCKGLAFKRYMSLLDADEFIAATACGDDVEHGKPDPRLVGMALHKLAIPGSQAVMVGDTPYDVEPSNRIGVAIIALRCGGWSDADLAGARSIFDDPADVLRHWSELPFPQFSPD